MSRLVPVDPFGGSKLLVQSLGQLSNQRQAQRALEQNQRAQQMQERLTLAKLAELDQANKLQQRRAGVLADLAAPQQVAGTGPLRGAQDYQPVQFQQQPLTRERVSQGLAAIGDVEGALKYMPEQVTPDYQLVQDASGQYVRVPKQPGLPNVPTGVQGEVGRDRVSVNAPINLPKQEDAFRKGMGEFYAEEFTGMQKDAQEALINKNRLERAQSLVTRLDTGRLKPTTTAIKSVIKDLGYDLTNLGLSDDVGLSEALKAVTVDLTMDTVSRTKGAVSNKEMELFAQVAPSLSNTTEGNLLIIEMANRLNDNKVKTAELARRYLAKNKTYDEGFYDELQKFYEKNPLFTDDIYRKVEKLTGASTEARGRGLTGLNAPDMSNVSDSDLLNMLGIGQ